MDRNTGLGFLMMLILLVAYYIFFAPDAPSPALPAAIPSETVDSKKESLAADKSGAVITAADTLAPDSARLATINAELQTRFGALAAATRGAEDTIYLANDRLRVGISTRGGLPISAVLSDYATYQDTTPVQLWDPEQSGISMKFGLKNGDVLSENLFFVPSGVHNNASAGGAATATFTAHGNQEGTEISVTYTLPANGYALETEVAIKGLEKDLRADENALGLSWRAAGLSKEKGIQNERQQSSVFFCPIGDKRDYLSENSEDEETSEQNLRWVAFKQQYFSAIAIAENGFKSGARIKSYPAEVDSLTMYYEADLIPMAVRGNDMRIPLTFYLGPNEYKNLKSLEVENLDRIIDYGWTIFGWLNRWFVRPMFNFFSGFIGNFGIIILVLTIVIKILLFPITWKNYLSSAKMKVLKPEIDAINKKFEGKDAMGKQQAVMGLYRQTGVNPFAGCIPMLLQMPILYAMFRFFPASIELRGQSFLWADDLGAFDVLIPLGVNIPLYGSHVSGFTLLMSISMFFYTRVSAGSMPDTTQPGMPNMKIIMNIFPFMMLFIFNSLSSGLSFYYFAANMISIGQMLAIKRWFIDEDKIKAKIEDNKKKPKKKSGFQERLEQMQKDQQKKLAVKKK